MGAFLLHRNEWIVALVALLGLLLLRIDSGVKNARARAKFENDPSFYKDAHQTEMIKEWVTSQYCKQDLDILCPTPMEEGSCRAAFTPPMRFVLDLDDTTQDTQNYNHHNCSMAYLIGHTEWKDRASITDSDETDDDTLIYFIAHLLEQVRTKSAKHFRAEDRSILEFEQSRLIGSVLASAIDLFSSPTKVNEEGQTLATKATDFELTQHLWTRGEVISFMHDAVLWHTHHQRHGHTSNGAAARVSRQMPSFVFKFLPLVKEQIQELETDTALTTRLQKLYSSHGHGQLSLYQDRPESDQCLWSHYEEDSLISQDCMLALETAPLKMRDLDWEGTFSFVLIHIFTWFSAAYMLWMLGYLRRKPTNASSTNTMKAVCTPQGMDVDYYSTMDFSSDLCNSLDEQIRTTQKISLIYLVVSCLVGWASSCSSETIQFSDFLDGMCMTLVGFLSLYLSPSSKVSGRSQANRDRHYKKRSSLLADEEDAA